MEKLNLVFEGKDESGNRVLMDDDGLLIKNIGDSSMKLELYTCSGGINGELGMPVIEIPKYKERLHELYRLVDETTAEEHYKYQLLGRLRDDCDYYLGYGGRNAKHLWATNVEEQIAKMKEIYNWFANDRKPEWLTFEQIYEYEQRMIN